jgi:hypothetical protein
LGLDEVEYQIAGDADRDRVGERRSLADREPGDLGQGVADQTVHGLASPKAAPQNCRKASIFFTRPLRQDQVDHSAK